MNSKTSVNQGLRRAGALAVVAAVAVLATACSGGTAPSATVATSAALGTVAQEVALAQCMRTHGVPGFPDPDPQGGFSLPAGMLESIQIPGAYAACRHLLPGGGESLAQIEAGLQTKLQQALMAALSYAECMRGHGLPTFPDPTLSGTNINLNVLAAGINPQSPQFVDASRVCQHLLSIGGASAQTHTTGTPQ
jgi:hypothetical protein